MADIQHNPDELRVPTVSAEGKRRWIYPDRRRGPKANFRGKLSLILMTIYFLAPFIQINGRPFIRFDFEHNHIHVIGAMFRFSDAGYFVFVFLFLALALFFVTSLWGRIWCGYACPQTVFVEWIIRPIEEFIEGKALHRQRQDQQPLTLGKALRKMLKHGLFLLVAFVVSNALLAYFVAPIDLWHWMTSSPIQHPQAFLLMVSVLGAIYIDLAWFREQFCSFLCPYARFQSVLMDRLTPTIGYDYTRGEPRGKRNTKGDCIDCGLCQRVCPTGIDIRAGQQMECIQCGRCADACDMIMASLKRPLGLIRNVSPLELERGKSPSRLRVRPIFYGLALMFLLAALVLTFARRDPLQVTFVRQPGVAYSKLPDGKLANLFQVRVVSRVEQKMNLNFQLHAEPGAYLTCSSCAEPLEPFEERRMLVVISFDTAIFHSRHVSLQLDGMKDDYDLPVILP